MYKLKKDITFIYMDRAEYQSYMPIYKEAENRGYKVRMTKNKFEKCEIGFYCQHVNFPQYSKFSVIMLHDIIQGYGHWPNIWTREPWDIYDIGFLPGKQWVQNWLESSYHPYAHPKIGIFEAGWPKADIISNKDFKKYARKLFEELKLNPAKKTVLYAPAWENDNKQDDFVQAMLKLDVNILIKQAPWSEKYFPCIVKNIQEMSFLHKNIEKVNIIDPNVNIIDVIAISDILVSDESSTLSEATILGKVALAVTDWLIPDTVPSRLPVTNHPFTVKTEKKDLEETVREIIKNYDKFSKKSRVYSAKNYSNLGETANVIMDILDSILDGVNISNRRIVSDKVILPIEEEEVRLRKTRDRKAYLFEKYYYGSDLVRVVYDIYKKNIKKDSCKNQ